MAAKLRIVLLALLGAALACTTPGSQITAPPETAQVYVVTATPLPATSGPPPTSTSALPPTAPPSTGPKFDPEIKFSTEPDPATATRTFKSGVKRIYGMWNYSGMTAGLTIRREWYLNGTLWIKRELPWDMGKYGASGTVTDVPIFDEENGLPDGQWEVRLYIDDKPQFAGDADYDFRTFTIGVIGDGEGLGPGGGSLTSPDGKLTAMVEPANHIAIEDGSGNWRTLVEDRWISGLDWLPDSEHIVYSDMTTSGTGYPLEVAYDLYIVDVETGDSRKLNNDGEDMHNPVVSPDGKTIALLLGDNFGDACSVSRIVAFMQIDPATQVRVELTDLWGFAGLALDSSAYTINGPDFVMPGVWQSATKFKTAVRFVCPKDEAETGGVYVLDMVSRSARKVGELSKG